MGTGGGGGGKCLTPNKKARGQTKLHSNGSACTASLLKRSIPTCGLKGFMAQSL